MPIEVPTAIDIFNIIAMDLPGKYIVTSYGTWRVEKFVDDEYIRVKLRIAKAGEIELLYISTMTWDYSTMELVKAINAGKFQCLSSLP